MEHTLQEKSLRQNRLVFIIVLFISFISSNFISAQNKKFELQYQSGLFFDLKKLDEQLNEFSPDMSSGTLDTYNLNEDLSFRLKITYKLSKNIEIDFIRSKNNLKGNNYNEIYYSKFDENGIIFNYILGQTKSLKLCINYGYSKINYSSERFLIYGSDFPHSSHYDETTANHYGVKTKYYLRDNFFLTFNYSIYNLKSDGIDGWDYNSGSYDLTFRSLGVGTTF